MLTDSHPRPTRLRPSLALWRWHSPAALALTGTAGSVVIGLIASRRPEYAIVACLVIALAIVVWRAPMAIPILAIVSFVWVPEDIFSHGFANYPQAQKLLILLAGLVMARRRGWRPAFAAPVFAYLTIVLFTEIGSTRPAGLTVHQTFLSLLTLTVCWVLFGVRWRREDAVIVLKILAWVPLACMALGFLMYAGHIWNPIDSHASPERLQGALIAPYLAGTAAGATVAALMLSRMERWRYAVPLLVTNAAIVALTITRGAMIATGLALLPSIGRLLRGWTRVQTPRQLLRLLVLAAVAIGVIAFVVTQVEARDAQTIFVPGRGEVKGDASSGRTAAWAFAYHAAKANLVFGRGLGSAPLIGSEYNHSFLAQHNEYLRMLLEGGFAGGILILLSIIVVVAWAVARSSRAIRVDLAAFALGFAIYSFTDNTLSNPQLALPITLTFALGAALNSRYIALRAARRPSRPYGADE